MAIAYINSKSTSASNAALTYVMTYTSTGGNTLVALAYNSGYTVTSITDSAGNTWIQSGSIIGMVLSLWYCVGASAITSITAHFSSSASEFVGLAIAEYSGVSNEATGTSNTGSSTPFTLTTSINANSFIVGGCFADVGTTLSFSGNTGNLRASSLTAGNSEGVAIGDNTVGGAGNCTLAFTLGGSSLSWDGLILILNTVTYPTITTQAVSAISLTTATGNGTISATGGANPTVEGVVINTASFATPANGTNPATVGTTFSNSGSFGTGAYTVSMTGLTAGTTYYACAYSTNSVGTSYGSVVSFTTLAYPTVATNGPSSIGTTAVAGNGNLTNLGGAANASAEGFMWQTSSFATPANGTAPSGTYVSNSGTFATGVFTGAITGLTANTNYWVCAFATTTTGTSWGAVQTFTTAVQPALTSTNFKFGGLIW